MTAIKSNIKVLLIVHALVTPAAGMVLILAPKAIPGTVGIRLPPEAYLLSYFLGAAETGIAYLSFFSARIKDRQALKIIVTSFIIFHLATGALEGFAIVHDHLSLKITGNIILRVTISVLLYYYGISN
ncbi:MAG TPA: hypothetical protein VFL76_03130 [Edaphocola sp.]|nr:hypothetical protein [Edaphocola sp.]